MLSLVRHENESLFIQLAKDVDPNMTVAELFKDGPIEIYVHDLRKTQIKIGIQAPQELNIVREEVLEK